MKYDNYYDNNETDENTYFDNTTKIDQMNDGDLNDIIAYFFLKQCNSNSVKEAISCVDEETYDLTETVSMASLNLNTDILNTSFWINELSYLLNGKCQTLNKGCTLKQYPRSRLTSIY